MIDSEEVKEQEAGILTKQINDIDAQMADYRYEHSKVTDSLENSVYSVHSYEQILSDMCERHASSDPEDAQRSWALIEGIVQSFSHCVAMHQESIDNAYRRKQQSLAAQQEDLRKKRASLWD